MSWKHLSMPPGIAKSRSWCVQVRAVPHGGVLATASTGAPTPAKAGDSRQPTAQANEK